MRTFSCQDYKDIAYHSALCDFFVLMAPGISTLTYLLTYLPFTEIDFIG